VGDKAPVNTDQPFFEFQVEKPVTALPGATPRYPDILRQAGVEGEVLAQFVVDTTGRAEMSSFRVLKASHDLFGTAVKNALPGMRFIPAEVGGRKVRQLVQQPFSFGIAK
jgi:protein TonB